VLNRRKEMIGAANMKYIKQTHCFGLEIPKTVKWALEIDAKMVIDYGRMLLQKKWKPLESILILDNGNNVPPGFQRMECHMIFNVKFDGFCQKARLVAGGQQTEPPASDLMYTSVLARETVPIAFTIAALNDLKVKASDVQKCVLDSTLHRQNHYGARNRVQHGCWQDSNHCKGFVWPEIGWCICPKASGRVYVNSGMQVLHGRCGLVVKTSC